MEADPLAAGGSIQCSWCLEIIKVPGKATGLFRSVAELGEELGKNLPRGAESPEGALPSMLIVALICTAGWVVAAALGFPPMLAAYVLATGIGLCGFVFGRGRSGTATTAALVTAASIAVAWIGATILRGDSASPPTTCTTILAPLLAALIAGAGSLHGEDRQGGPGPDGGGSDEGGDGGPPTSIG